MAVNGVEIKAGQRWRTRRGEVVTTRPTGGVEYPWYAERGEPGHPAVTVANDGRVYIRGIGDPDDLVALIEDAPNSTDQKRTGATMGQLAQGLDNVRKALQSQGQTEPKPDLVGPAETFYTATQDTEHPYHLLATTLLKAFQQAASGKGKERHAQGDTPFHEQPMATINRQLGSVDGFIYQAHKKSLEAKRLPDGRAQAELLGAINYLAGAVIALDTWAKKAPTGDAAELHALEENRRRMNAMAAAVLSKGKKS